jgi:thymidylate synthase
VPLRKQENIIDSFVDLGFGKPVLRIETCPDGKMFIGAGVIRDDPCGSTWFVAKKLGWTDAPGYKETISGTPHSYPCTGSMDKDPQLGDTILHKAGYIIREVVEDGMDSEKMKRPDDLQTRG